VFTSSKICQRPLPWLLAIALVLPVRLYGQQGTDTAFQSLQERGKHTMGVDQTTSTHQFESLPDGGRITLVRNMTDSVGTDRIRSHLHDMERAFGSGDFSMPMFIHMKTVPGIAVMKERRSLIRYQETDRPNGGQLRITTSDSVALAAIHDFLAFQRGEHRAGTP
jgi:hypothetical protein